MSAGSTRGGNAMTEFDHWLATSPTASFIKIALSGALGAVASYLATAEVHPLWVLISSAVIPIAINWLNPEDPRYGRDASE